MNSMRQPELDFIGAARARRRDPVTSHEAAEMMQGEPAAGLERLVYSLLANAFPGGLTMPEMSVMTDIDRDSLSPRTRSLRDKDLIHDSGEKRINPKSNCWCIVWKQGPPPSMRMTREQLHALGWKPDGKGGVIPVAGGEIEARPIDGPQIRMPSRKGPNRTEQRWYDDHKHEFVIGQDFRYNAITLVLPSGTRYTPDWTVWTGSRLETCIEVKGGHIHNDASIRAFKEAAAAWPMFAFEFAQWKGGKWHRTHSRSSYL